MTVVVALLIIYVCMYIFIWFCIYTSL